MEAGEMCPNCNEVNLRAVEIIDKDSGRKLTSGLWCDACQVLIESD